MQAHTNGLDAPSNKQGGGAWALQAAEMECFHSTSKLSEQTCFLCWHLRPKNRKSICVAHKLHVLCVLLVFPTPHTGVAQQHVMQWHWKNPGMPGSGRRAEGDSYVNS